MLLQRTVGMIAITSPWHRRGLAVLCVYRLADKLRAPKATVSFIGRLGLQWVWSWEKGNRSVQGHG
jgi:hypothetical protein